MHKFAAHAVFWFHLLWIALVLGGTFAQFYFPSYQPIHLSVVLITIGAKLAWRGSCPLVNLENALLKRSGAQTYQGSFIRHYVKRYLDVTLPHWFVDAMLGAIALVTLIAWL